MTTKEKVLKAYELLATSEIALHIEGLNLLDEARAEDYVTVMETEHELDQYKVLQITAIKETTDIYLSDMENNLVQHETGYMLTSVAPGKYKILFGIDKKPITIELTQDMKVNE
jgi:hypothetical protein